VLLHKLLPHLTHFRLLAHHWIEGVLSLDLRARQRSAACPSCRQRSTAVHSGYRRTVADVPLGGAKTRLRLHVRRFFCRYASCPQRIFAEQFPTLVPVRGRHTRGVCVALRHVGIAVGGRAGMRLAQAVGLPGSRRTMVRLIHGTPFPPLAAPRVIGLDEWAWRRGRRFGTIVCDLERHQVIDLLPVRTAPAVAQWLQAQPSVEIVCRDRSRLYAEGIRHGAPQAVQVVDRFHLVQNLGDALERLFLRYRRDLNSLGASLNRASEPTPTPATLSQARHTRWVHLYHQIQWLHAQHVGIAAIARQVQVSRPTVYRYLAMPQPPERQRSRHRGQPLVAPFTPYVRRRWNAGCRNAQQLWRELMAQGYRPGAADGGAVRRPTAAGDGLPIQVPPSRASAPLCGGPERESSCPIDRSPSGTPVSFETGRPALDRSGPLGAPPPRQSGHASHISPGPNLFPHDP
jgi:transposase